MPLATTLMVGGVVGVGGQDQNKFLLGIAWNVLIITVTLYCYHHPTIPCGWWWGQVGVKFKHICLELQEMFWFTRKYHGVGVEIKLNFVLGISWTVLPSTLKKYFQSLCHQGEGWGGGHFQKCCLGISWIVLIITENSSFKPPPLRDRREDLEGSGSKKYFWYNWMKYFDMWGWGGKGWSSKWIFFF